MSYAIRLLEDEEVRRHLSHDEHAHCGALSTSRGHLPLAALSVHARIAGLLAETEVSQTFVNNTGEPVEATYIFPLPSRAAVTSFRFEVDGRVVEGVLKERGAARREYDAALRAGHRAAITEEERPDVFTMRVGNLMPGEHARVRLTLAGPLPLVDGEATFRFPLVVAPRYMPGRALGGEDVGDGVAGDTDAVPDASRISPPVLLPGYPNPVRLDLVVDLDEGDLRVTDLRSSLHAVFAEGSPHGVRRLRVQPGERLNRDFLLRLSYATAGIETGLALCPDEARPDEGTFALTVVPPHAGAVPTKPRDIVFVLDRSGSMDGWKMVAARRAVARMIDSLRDDDRFLVIAFDNNVEMVQPALTQATDRERYRAVEKLGRLQARGGTEMYKPLQQALASHDGGYLDRERVVVLITDGQVGNESQILKLVKERLRATRLFTLGVDRAVNAGFLERMATMTGGSSELVESEDRLDAVLGRIAARIESPVLAGLFLSAEGLSVDMSSVVPARLPDLFAGAPLTIQGRYRGQPRGSVVLSATTREGQAFRQRIEGGMAHGHAVEKCWARGRVRDLEDRFDAGERHLAPEITALSLRHGVLCKLTSFVAVDHAVVVNPGGYQRRVTQAVESPDGWAMLGAADSLAARAPGAPSARAKRVGRAAAPTPAAAPVADDRGAFSDDTDGELLLDAGDGLDSTAGMAVASADPADLAMAESASVPAGAPLTREASADPRVSYGLPRSAPSPKRAEAGLVPRIFGAGRAIVDAISGGGVPAGGGGNVDLAARAADILAAFRKLPRATAEERKTTLRVLETKLEALIVALRAHGMPPLDLVPVEVVHRAVRDAVQIGDLLADEHAAKLLSFVEDSLVAFAAGTRAPPLPALPPLVVAGGRRREGEFWR